MGFCIPHACSDPVVLDPGHPVGKEVAVQQNLFSRPNLSPEVSSLGIVGKTDRQQPTATSLQGEGQSQALDCLFPDVRESVFPRMIFERLSANVLWLIRVNAKA